ncbi:MAG: hypothetical protein KAT66_09375 [Candidatus Lokiarchaeota archaeon]|nr:hypothetical protein [Candidatus Lokiarchaeota archaeon]
MVSEQIWKKIWLLFGIVFMFISIFMIFFGPWLASITGTKPFSDRARAMINFFWIWMFIYNGLGFLLLYKNTEKYKILLILAIPAGITFTILQIIYIILGYFEFVLSEIVWAISSLVWSTIAILYFFDKKKDY